MACCVEQLRQRQEPLAPGGVLEAATITEKDGEGDGGVVHSSSSPTAKQLQPQRRQQRQEEGRGNGGAAHHPASPTVLAEPAQPLELLAHEVEPLAQPPHARLHRPARSFAYLWQGGTLGEEYAECISSR